MNFSLFIAKRYLFSKNTNNAVNIITAISIVGVAFGAMALLVVLSAFSGLEKFSISMLSTFNPDIKITSNTGKTLSFNENIEKTLKDNDQVAFYSKTLEEKVFLRYKDKEFISKIKGVDSNFKNVNRIESSLYAGRWPENTSSNEILVGGGIAHFLSLGLNGIYNRLEIYVVKPGTGQISDPLSGFRRLDAIPVGLFAIEKDVDEKYIISNMSFAQELLRYDSTQISAIELKLKDASKDFDVADELKKSLGANYNIETQKEQNSVIYRMMNTEKLVTYLVFTLILIIAIFNVIGSISMLIVDKKKNISTLWNLGASEKELRKIFTKVGLLITVIGGISGIILGSAIVLAQYYFEFIRFGGAGSLAYPVELNISNIVISSITIFVIGFVASKFSVRKLKKEVYAI